MSHQHRLARHLFSSVLLRSQRTCILQQEANCLHQRAILSNYSTFSSSSGSTLVDALIPAAVQSTKPDTRRNAERQKDKRNHSQPKAESNPNFSAPLTDFNFEADFASKGRWTPEEDNWIINLFNKNYAWNEIDKELKRPLSSCYHRYYSVLDPNLKEWDLPNGQPDMSMLKRLAYLVEVEKHSFAKIEKLRLMLKPWDAPTIYAPPEILAAVETKPVVQKRRRRNTSKQSAAHKTFNKMTLQKKYNDYKGLLAKNSVQLNKTLLHRAVRRSVELYGENWKKVAVHADMLLDHWTSSKAIRIEEVVASAVATSGGSGKRLKKSALYTAQEREPMSPTEVASLYRILQRNGVDWGLEDDVVMTRKVLNLMEKESNLFEILTRPFGGSVSSQQQEKEARQAQDQTDNLQQQYWSEISIALGNHSPTQCKRRWDGLWTTKDEEKSAQSKSWHRFERFHFWTLWKHFYQQHKSLGDKAITAGSDLYDLESYQGLDKVCKELSFAKEISRWMRHRTEAQCEKYFKSAINSAVRHDSSLAAQHRNRQILQQEQGQEQQQMQTNHETTDQQDSPSRQEDEGLPVSKNMKLFSAESLLNSILTKAAEPLLEKMSSVYPEIEHTILNDHHQPIVRADWTREKIKALYDIAMEEKRGVMRGNFEINWSKVASRLEKKLESDNISNVDDDTTNDQHLSARSEVEHPLRYPSTYITPKQCQNCWEYITSPAATETKSLLNIASSRSGPETETETETESGLSTANSESNSWDGHEDHHSGSLQDWSDHELQLLQQGVRKFGNSWADIRAQYLPNRNITDLYQTWLTITVPAKKETAGSFSRSQDDRVRRSNVVGEGDGYKRERKVQVNRLAEPDYVGLLSALDKIGGSANGKTGTEED
ncbi:hypothetical protein BGX27_011544 [Mortierella sp. AM989]|nr:hypothetical protein BGX27_011544 [Mortierella sp. AM989]